MSARILCAFKAIVLIWIYLHGLWLISLEFLFFPFSLPLITILVSILVLQYFHLPAPRPEAVNAVIGKDPAEDSENDAFVMKVVAHRGAGLDAPENSLVAFRMCAEKGCLGIELDVTLTADDVPVVFHDDTLERLADSSAAVDSMTWHELKSVDISIKHPLKEKFPRTHIAKFDETIVQCLKDNQRIFIDIKGCSKKLISTILDLFEKYPELKSKAVCSSFYPNVIYMIRSKNPQIICSLAWRPHFFGYEWYTANSGAIVPRSNSIFKQFALNCFDILYEWIFSRLIYYVVGISAVLIHKDAMSAKLVREWREKGVRVIAWTVNHPVEKQHFSRILKVTYMTDTLIGESTAHIRNS